MDIKYINYIKKRYKIMGILIIFLFLGLALGLYYLQIYNHEELSSRALNQRGREIALEPQRGIIFDRNKVPLTNNEIIPVAIIERVYLEENPILFEKIQRETILSRRELYQLIDSKEDLLRIPLKEETTLENYRNNLFIVNVINRYNRNNLLSHVLGYASKSDNQGQSGIEKVYDEYLNKNDKNSFVVEYDRNRSLILDGDYYVNQNIDPYEPAGVKLTIDYQVQNIIENILDKNRLNGSIIVSETESGEILAMASRPNFSQENVHDYFLGEDMSLYNKAIQVGYPPGSIFKIIVLLTALEEEPNLLDNTYLCKGFEVINGTKINCSGEHGWINIREGFAKSCNSLFIQIAKELEGEKIINMAYSLGLGEKINIGLLEEMPGYLPNKYELKGAAIGNIAIGQGSLEVTPLQLTNLMNVVVNKGTQIPMSLVEGITNKDGYMIKEVMLDKKKQILSEESAEYIKELLGDVVLYGTAKSMELDTIGGAGGKTGTSEAILNGQSVVHGWFVGFYPFENPKYVITVLIEDALFGSRTATPIFEEIAKEINNLKFTN